MDVDLPMPVPASSAGANHVSTSSQPLQREHSTSQDKEDPNEGSESDAQLNNNFCLFASDQVTLKTPQLLTMSRITGWGSWSRKRRCFCWSLLQSPINLAENASALQQSGVQ